MTQQWRNGDRRTVHFRLDWPIGDRTSQKLLWLGSFYRWSRTQYFLLFFCYPFDLTLPCTADPRVGDVMKKNSVTTTENKRSHILKTRMLELSPTWNHLYSVWSPHFLSSNSFVFCIYPVHPCFVLLVLFKPHPSCLGHQTAFPKFPRNCLQYCFLPHTPAQGQWWI